MTVSVATTPSARRESILESATAVFLRYGFRKASMDDLARAAGLSRQGLYLHFATKDALFREAVLHLLATTRDHALSALSRSSEPTEARLLAAFEALHAHGVGLGEAEHLSELLVESERLVGTAVADMERELTGAIATLLQGSGSAERWAPAGISAHALAEQLYLTSLGLKHRAANDVEFRDGMRTAIRIIAQPAS
jgi:AcrR family transcriptional regulator